MADIFICYRRTDSEAYAGRLHDSLTGKFGERSVFIDVDNLHPGVDFNQVIQRTLGRSRVVLVVIGPKWVGPRIADEQDFVRREILAALRARKHIIPVLVGGTVMPSRERVPADIAELVGRNAVVLNHATWKHDVDRLVRSLEKLLGRGRPAATKPALKTKPSRQKKKPSAPKKTPTLRESPPTTPKKTPVLREAPTTAAKKTPRPGASPSPETPGRTRGAPNPPREKSPTKRPAKIAPTASTKPKARVGKKAQPKQTGTDKAGKGVGGRLRRGRTGKGGAGP